MCTFPMLIKHALTMDVPIILHFSNHVYVLSSFLEAWWSLKPVEGLVVTCGCFLHTVHQSKSGKGKYKIALLQALSLVYSCTFLFSFYAVSFTCWSTLVYNTSSTIPGFYCISHTGTYKLSTISTHKVTEK